MNKYPIVPIVFKADWFNRTTSSHMAKGIRWITNSNRPSKMEVYHHLRVVSCRVPQSWLLQPSQGII